jgi:pimeloyl-ACP methyl ester carboxylesterase
MPDGSGAVMLFPARLSLSDRRCVLPITLAGVTGLRGATTMLASIQTAAKPTIVLVHGAFADASCWNDVVPHLQREGYTVVAPPNPLRGLAADAAYVASFVRQVEGPVLLVGHSYGGAVVTNAGTEAANVVGLVYVAAFAPDEGESLQSIETDSRDSVLLSALVQYQYPTGRDAEMGVEFAINPTRLREVFAADLPPERTAVMAVTQRPISLLAFTEPSGPPAWKRVPSWAAVPTGDKAVGSDVVRSMAQRAKATIVELEGSHVIMMSEPGAVADLILRAARAVGEPANGSGRIAARASD